MTLGPTDLSLGYGSQGQSFLNHLTFRDLVKSINYRDNNAISYTYITAISIQSNHICEKILSILSKACGCDAIML